MADHELKEKPTDEEAPDEFDLDVRHGAAPEEEGPKPLTALCATIPPCGPPNPQETQLCVNPTLHCGTPNPDVTRNCPP
jgi:hypothetical protein